MSWLFRSRASARRRREQELDEEIRTHIRMATAERVERGESPEEAERAVLRELGNLTQVKEVTRSMWGGQWPDRLMQDLRFAWRGLRRSPGFGVMAIATLALGIGATTAIFSLFDTILLTPLPYPQPQRLVQIWETSPRDGSKGTLSGINADVWPRAASSLAAMGVYRSGRSVALTGEGAPRLLSVADVQPSLAQVLGVEPLLGRTFTAEEAHGDGHQAVLLYGTWQQTFGGDPGIVGRTLTLDNRPVEIVGVMPRGFDFPATYPDFGTDLWMPLSAGPLGLDPTSTVRSLLAVGRLRDGVTLGAAQAELAAIYRNQQAEHPEIGDLGVALVPLHEEITGSVRLLLTLLLVSVGLVLFVACGNLANLLLARAVGREREIAVRGALGAGNLRIVRQLLTESLLLGILGGAASLLIAPLLLRTFVAIAPADLPLVAHAAIDRDAFLCAGALSLLSVLVFGLAPALQQMQSVSRTALQSGRGTAGGAVRAGRARLRAGLLVAQVALAVVLLVGAGLLVRTLTALSRADLGFDQEDLLTFAVVLPVPKYPAPEQQNQFFDQLLERVRTTPGVTAASGSTSSPGLAGRMSFPFVVEGRSDGRPATAPSGCGREEAEDPEDYRVVADDYFDVIRQPVIRGRGFNASDRADSPPVVVINQALARKVWKDQDPIGQRIAVQVLEQRSAWQEVIGVVADARLEGADRNPSPRIYAPYSQHRQLWESWLILIARVEGPTDPGTVHRAMTAALHALDPQIPPRGLGSVEGAYRLLSARRTFATTLALAFGLSALLLSVLGLYGLISYSVAAQKKEISLRMALGADLTQIAGSVLGGTLQLATAGVVCGALAALVATRAIGSLLFGVSPLDSVTYAAALLVVLLAALGAASIPAWRAARINPVDALSGD